MNPPVRFCHCGCGEALPPDANPRRIYISSAHNCAAFAERRRTALGHTKRRRKPPGIDEMEWLLQNRHIDPETNCWEWTGARFNTGYGMVRYKGTYLGAHRVMWLELRGPTNGLCVLHRCDNRPCFNPDHLWLGTIADNNDDKIAKGRDRSPRGESHPRTKLTNEQVRAILTDTRSDRLIGLDYGVSANAIWNIQAGKVWTHLS